MKGVGRDMLQGVMGWNWIGEANTGEAGENNCMKLTQKKSQWLLDMSGYCLYKNALLKGLFLDSKSVYQ